MELKKRYTIEYIISEVEKQTGGEYIVLQVDEKGSRKEKRKMTLRHNEEKGGCGHEYRVEIYEFIKDGKRRCQKCKGEKLRRHFARDIEEVRRLTRRVTNGEYSFIDSDYLNGKTLHLFRHERCGKSFKKKFEKFLDGQRCPFCHRKGSDSQVARYVQDIFDELEIDYVKEKRFIDCINPDTGFQLPFDYYLPKANLLIEIDGVQHTRPSFSIEAHKGQRARDRVKDQYANDRGIEILRIPEKDWPRLHEILLPIINSLLARNIGIEELRAISQKETLDRVNADLTKAGKGEYRLVDRFYFGVDHPHRFLHIPCGTVFTDTLYNVKKVKQVPCPDCPNPSQIRFHRKTDLKIRAHSHGRYCLDPNYLKKDKKNRYQVLCKKCLHSWRAWHGNILKDKGGCPHCLQCRKEREWMRRLTQSLKGETKSHRDKSWWYNNRKAIEEGKLKGWRRRTFLRFLSPNEAS